MKNVEEMKQISLDCFLSVQSQLGCNFRKDKSLNVNGNKGFELLGFDFMIDEDMKTWLIEVNVNPYIGIHNKELNYLLPEMFTSLFEVVFDGPDKLHEENQFELLYKK